VNVSSTAGRVARPASSAYSLTRFGLAGFAESLRQELLTERVRVSVVAPGAVEPEFEGHRGAAGRQPGGTGSLRPADVADAIAWIVTREPRVAVNELLIRGAEQTW
jgi:NADP-dependent 3-hydroxy acid dehydrogenase YdfG